MNYTDLKTIAKLIRLVEDAYEEGHEDGYQRGDWNLGWEHSDTKKDLEILKDKK